MKFVKRYAVLILLVVTTLLVQSANAIPVGSKVFIDSLDDEAFTSDPCSPTIATIDCSVYQYTSGDYAGKYLYTYQISNESTMGISFFSVGILDGASVELTGYETDGVLPALWTVIGSLPGIQSVEALFSGPIYNGQSSALLWFVANGPPVLDEGALFGTSSGGIPVFTTGNVLTSVPEPGTFVLLGAAGLSVLIRKRRFI